MKFINPTPELAVFTGIDPFLAEIIKQLPVAADPKGCEAARERLFSSPGTEAEGLEEDWREYVTPDLEVAFQTATEVVLDDLGGNFLEDEHTDDEPSWRLSVPREHVDAWLNTMNRARLVLAERYEFSDEELAGERPLKLTSLRDLGLYQITIYGWMQELLLTTI